MKKWIYTAVLILLSGCRGEKQEIWLTNEKASAYFREIEAVCNRDNGRLWGRNLYGPVMFVDRNARKIFANEPDNEGLLKDKDGIFTGTFPKELVINNNPVYFGETLFAQAPLRSEEEEEYRIISRAIHGLFHYFQETAGYTTPEYNTMNMDERNARLWLKLEWKALRKAINSEGAEQQLAIRDALVFRGSNRELYQKYSADETRFENYEGLATFTYILLCTDSPDEFKRRLFEVYDRIYNMQSYVRSYGSLDGALYATLMYRKGFDFSIIKSANVDLGEKVRELNDIQLPEVCRDVAGSLALNYDIETIRNEEAKREADIQDRIHRQTSIFTEKPVVFLELESPYFDFEPEDIHPMDTLGILYSRIRVSDNWGKLTVDKDGCLLSNNLKYLRITAKGFKSDRNKFEGEGWHLSLNDEWELVPVGQNYFVRKITP
jgi:hypothetical protein